MRKPINFFISSITGILHLSTRAGLLAACACGVAHAQENFDNGMPDWRTSTGTLEISPDHYKTGSQSLRWDWNGGSVITIDEPEFEPAGVRGYNQNTCTFWVWNGTALPDSKLSVEFMKGAIVQYSFDFYLNFTGWRRAVRSFRYDMTSITDPSSDFTSVRIKAPLVGQGNFYLDAVNWTGSRESRIRDGQNPDITGEASVSDYATSYAQLPPASSPDPAPLPSQEQLNDLTTLRGRWLAEAMTKSAPTQNAVDSAVASYNAMSIVGEGNNIRGKVVGQDMIALEEWPLVLARDYAWNPGKPVTPAEPEISRTRMLKLAYHLMDQGQAANSNLLPTSTAGINYSYRQLPIALILMAPAYDNTMKEKTWDWFRWAYKVGDFWSGTYERNTDDVHLHAFQLLGAILFLNSDAEAVRLLDAQKLYYERFWAFSDGSEDGVKVDGVGFHHRSHYNNYMYAYNTMVGTAHQLRGTGFQIGRGAYENLRFAFLTYLRMSADGTGNTIGYFGNSLCGRKAFDINTSISQYAMRQLGELGGDFTTPESSADPVVARAYNRRFGVNDYPLFTSAGVEPSPDGFYQFNYSPLGIYRRNSWVASIRAPQRYFWSTEIWKDSNVYGRFQAYGALEMLYHGMVSSRTPKNATGNDVTIPDPDNSNSTIPKVVTVRSGQSIDGWDWSQPPGTTTIKLEHEELGNKEREDVRSQLNFSGALAFRSGPSEDQSQSGLYAANFRESKPGTIVGPNHDLDFMWRKSWFCFDSLIVCLGSNISSSKAGKSVVTTLFQGVLPTRLTPTTLNGQAIIDFPKSQTVDGPSAPWLLDSYGTGFLVQLQPGGSLNISRGNQTSSAHTGTGATTTDDFAKAWINHGERPSDASYEYAVFPATTAGAMAAAATDQASPIKASKLYHVYQHDSAAHVVRRKAQVGYSIFVTKDHTSDLPSAPPDTRPKGLSISAQNAGLLISVERPCLVMTQLDTGGDAWISVVDPDLNFSHPQAAYNLPDASVARTLNFTVHGLWTVHTPGASTVISAIPNTTTIRVTTQHGLATHVILKPEPQPAATTWANVETDWTDPASWGANWGGGSPPTNDPESDIAALGAATVQPVLTGPYAVKGLTLDGGTNLSGSGNLLLGTGGVVATGTNNAFAISNLTLHADQTWDIGPGSLTVSSIIGGHDSAALTKAGSGSLILSGTNTYSGGLTIAQGNVSLSGDQSAATGSIDQKAPGTSLSIGNTNQTSLTHVVVGNDNSVVIGETADTGNADRILTVTGSPGFATSVTNHGSLKVGRGALATVGPNASWLQNGRLDIVGVGGYSASLAITTGGQFTYAGDFDIELNPASGNSGSALLTISDGGSLTTSRGFVFGSAGTGTGSGQFTLSGQGKLRLSADIAELFTGASTGSICLAGGGIIDTNGFTTTLSRGLTNMPAVTGSLHKTGNGRLTLSGINSYTGPTKISGGTLATGLLANNGIASGIGAGTGPDGLVIDGGTLQYTGAALTWTRNFTIGTEGAEFNLSSATGQLNIQTTVSYGGNGLRSMTFTTGSVGGRLNSALGDGPGGPTKLVKQGTGTLLVSGTNTYSGPLQILAGSVQYGNAGLGGESTGNGHSVGISGGAALNFRHAGNNTVAYNAPITGEGSVSMNYNNASGGGSLTLGGNNTFSGGLTINPTSGTNSLPLKAGGPSALGSGRVTIGQYGQLDLNGHSNTTGLLTSTHGNARITNTSPDQASLTLDGTTTQTFGGSIQNGGGRLSIIKSGSGTQRFTGPINYTGDTTVTGGTLSLGQINPDNESSTVTINSSSVLELAFSGTDTVARLFINGVQQAPGDYTNTHPSGAISGAGTLRVIAANIIRPPGYADWADVNAPQQNAGMDHDNDGVQNGIEYFMGLAGSGFTANPVPDANRLVSWPMGANYQGIYGIDYVVQISTDLVAWSDVPQSGVTIATGNAVSYSVVGPGIRFVRLFVRQN